MNRIIKNAFIGLLLVCFLISVPALGQTGGDYDLSWNTLDGGGNKSTGGSYSLSGTIGQHDTSEPMEGGEFTLNGGFWPGTFGCIVNLTDLSNFMAMWLESGVDLPADLDGDGDVDNVDFSDLAYYWLDYCPAGWQLK